MSVEFPVFNFEEDSPYEVLRCSICNGYLNDPRMLPCLHTFCLECLEDYINIDCQIEQDFSNNSPNGNHHQHHHQHHHHRNSGGFFNSFFSKVTGTTSSISEEVDKKCGEFPCPICKKKVIAPPEGLVNLPVNFFLEKFLQIQQAADKKDDRMVPAKSVICEVCRSSKLCGDSGGGDSSATRFCVDCNQHLCQRCVEYHKLLKTTNSHKLVSLGSQIELLHRLDEVFCRVHKSEKVDVYCKTCSTAQCRICFVSQEHSGHSGCGVAEASVELRKKLSDGIEGFAEELETINSNLKEVEEISDRFNSTIENIENSIQNKEEEMKEVLYRHSEKLRQEVDDKKRVFNKELSKVKDSLEKHKILLDQFNKYAGLVLRKASNATLACSARDIITRFAELNKMAVPELMNELEPSFTPSKLSTEVVLGRRMSVCGGVGAGTIRNKITGSGETIGVDENLIGFLEFKTKFSKKKMKAATVSKTPHVLQSYPFNDFAIAMASISDDENDFLCCATYSSNDIQVIDVSCLDKKQSSAVPSTPSSTVPGFKSVALKVAALKNAFSMTVVENHLYITEWKSDMVHKIEVVVDLGIDSEVAPSSYDKWSLGTEEGLNCLSTTKDGRSLLVTCPEVNNLMIFEVDGRLKRKIPLDSSIDKPSESLQLNDDDGKDSMVITENETSAVTYKEPYERFVVSHSGTSLDRICLIDGYGKLLATYGNIKGGPGAAGRMNYNANYHQKQQQLNGPYRMAADMLNNLLFVSDHYNHRIILLNSLNLTILRELIKPTFGLSFPLDLLFDTKRQLLHVADLDNKRFVTFTFQ